MIKLAKFLLRASELLIRRVVIICIVFLGTSFEASSYATNGYLDLRYETFETPIELSGQWEFYWGRLINPGQFIRKGSITDFPALWSSQIIGKDTISSRGVATYRLKLLLPEQVSDYDLYVDDMYSAYKLFVDGRVVASNGTVGETKETSIPYRLPQVVQLRDVEGTTDLVLQISNFHHSKGGNASPILIAKTGYLSERHSQHIGLDFVLFCIMIAFALFYLVRLAVSSFDTSTFYFVLFLFAYSYRTIGTDLYHINEYIPDIPWLISMRMEYLSLFMAALAFGLFVKYLYPHLIVKNIITTFTVLCSVFLLCSFVLPAYYFTMTMKPFFVMMLLYIIYGFYIYMIAVVGDEPGSIFGMLSVATVFTIFVYKIFIYFQWLPHIYFISFSGHLLFLIFQSIQLFLLSKQRHMERASL
ncbi:MAG: hypothetical protein ACI8QD_000057 [Cyclobacteriaceae bacterium]|jgi:hypothetical protein